MSLVQTHTEIEYPESDGKPMAETDVHFEWTVYIRDVLKRRYRGQQVYVASDLLVYYVEGDPRKSVAPDEFVVKDCDPGPRRTFRIWEEQRTPDVVIEVTSASTRSEDEHIKPGIYAQIGVKEVFLYDPTADYLQPPLQGFRLTRQKKTRITADDSGALNCRELGLLLRLDEDGALQIFDATTEARLLTDAEAEHAACEQEQHRREQAEARAEAAELELERLRDEMRRRGNK